MSRLRVAIVTPGSFVIPSGKSSSVELVAMQIGERLNQQTEVIIFGKKKGKRPARETIKDVRFVRTAAKPYIRHIGRAMKKEQLDVIQVENRPRYAKYLKRLHPQKPVVLSLHSTVFISRPHISEPSLRSCLRSVDAIVVNSQYLKDKVAAMDPSSDSKIVVNHLGVDTDRFVSKWAEGERGKREEKLEKLGLAGKKIVLYVGRFIPKKGVHHLLAAMPAITALEPDAVLLLVGGAFYGSNRKTAYVRKLHKMASIVKSNVRFVPFVPHNEISDWFRLADVVVVPSARQEAFGLVNVEAMASGVPVVATAVGGMTEIIKHEQSGLLVRSANISVGLAESICSVLADPGYARSLGENGLDRVRERFTWEHTTKRLLELYRKLDGSKE